MGPKKANILCLVYQGVFGHFPTIPDYFKISEDYRRLMKMSKDYQRCQLTTKDFQEQIQKFSTCCYRSHGKFFLRFTDSNFFQG